MILVFLTTSPTNHYFFSERFFRRQNWGEGINVIDQLCIYMPLVEMFLSFGGNVPILVEMFLSFLDMQREMEEKRRRGFDNFQMVKNAQARHFCHLNVN